MRRPTLTSLSLFNFAAIVLIWILQNFIGEQTGPTALLTYTPQHGFGLLSLILIGCAWKARRRPLVAFNTLSFGLFAFLLLGFQLPALRFGNPKTVRVMTYNILGAMADTNKIAAEIRAQNPDIVCLQESGFGVGDRVASHFPGWESYSAGDVTTFSRYPLVSSQEWPFRGTRRIVEMRWKTPHGVLRVLNAHIATSMDNQRSPRSRLKRIFLDARPAAMTRLEQLPYLWDASNEARYRDEATIMCGDFNTPPRGIFYRTLRGEWDEAFAQSGFGLGQTYPRKLPVLRIDYIWMKNGVSSKRAFVPAVNGSDHLPLVSDLIVR